MLLTVTALFYDDAHFVFWAAMAFLGFLQVTALLLNLLPVPGLDGYGALEPHLSRELQAKLNPVKQWGFFVLLLLLFVPLLNKVFFGVVSDVVGLTGVDQYLVGWGTSHPILVGLDLTNGLAAEHAPTAAWLNSDRLRYMRVYA